MNSLTFIGTFWGQLEIALSLMSNAFVEGLQYWNPSMKALWGNYLKRKLKMLSLALGMRKPQGRMGAFFFKKAWDYISTDFYNAIKEFFISGKMLKQVNHSLLVLIPKSLHASKVEEFRPIACCNVFYKVIAKILVARIRPVLPSESCSSSIH